MKTINDLFSNKEWEGISNYPPEDIVNVLGFKNGMIAAYNLLYNEKWDEYLQIFAVNLIYSLKEKYNQTWNLDWRNDAFLGQACDIVLKYDERYQAYQQAFEKSLNPPPELLIELARCCYCPGSPPISYEQSIELLQISIKKHPYKQAACLLKSIYASKKDLKNERYWSEMLEKITDENLPPIEPKFLVEEYLQEKKSLN